MSGAVELRELPVGARFQFLSIRLGQTYRVMHKGVGRITVRRENIPVHEVVQFEARDPVTLETKVVTIPQIASGDEPAATGTQVVPLSDV